MPDYQALGKATAQGGTAGLLLAIVITVFLIALCASHTVFRGYLERVTRAPPRRRPPLLTPLQ